MAQCRRDPAPQHRHLLRLPLLPGHARGQGTDRHGDRLPDPDPDLATPEPGRDQLHHPELFRVPRRRAGSDFPTGAAPRPGRTGRASDLFPDERETRDRARPGRSGDAAFEQAIRRLDRDRARYLD